MATSNSNPYRRGITNTAARLLLQNPYAGLGWAIGEGLGTLGANYNLRGALKKAEQKGLEAGGGYDYAAGNRALDAIQNGAVAAPDSRGFYYVDPATGQQVFEGQTAPTIAPQPQQVPQTPQAMGQQPVTMDNPIGNLQAPQSAWDQMSAQAQYNNGNTGLFTNGIRNMGNVIGNQGGFDGYSKVMEALEQNPPKSYGAKTNATAAPVVTNEAVAMNNTPQSRATDKTLADLYTVKDTDSEFDKARKNNVLQNRQADLALERMGVKPKTDFVDANRVLGVAESAATGLPEFGKQGEQMQAVQMADGTVSQQAARKHPFNVNLATAAAAKYLMQKGYDLSEINAMLAPYKQEWQERQNNEYRSEAQAIMNDLNNMKGTEPEYQSKLMELSRYDPEAAKLYAGNVTTQKEQLKRTQNKEDYVWKQNVSLETMQKKWQLMDARQQQQVMQRVQQLKQLYPNADVRQLTAMVMGLGGKNNGTKGTGNSALFANKDWIAFDKRMTDLAEKIRGGEATKSEMEFYDQWENTWKSGLNSAFGQFGMPPTNGATTTQAPAKPGAQKPNVKFDMNNWDHAQIALKQMLKKEFNGVADDKFARAVRKVYGLSEDNENPNEWVNSDILPALGYKKKSQEKPKEEKKVETKNPFDNWMDPTKSENYYKDKNQKPGWLLFKEWRANFVKELEDQRKKGNAEGVAAYNRNHPNRKA